MFHVFQIPLHCKRILEISSIFSDVISWRWFRSSNKHKLLYIRGIFKLFIIEASVTDRLCNKYTFLFFIGLVCKLIYLFCYCWGRLRIHLLFFQFDLLLILFCVNMAYIFFISKSLFVIFFALVDLFLFLLRCLVFHSLCSFAISRCCDVLFLMLLTCFPFTCFI